MANYWMVVGVGKDLTGSYDQFMDTNIESAKPATYVKGKDYAYIGIAATGHPSQSFWASGSNNDINDRNAQMFTPFPAGTEIGKLYFATAEVLNDNDITSSIPASRTEWSNLDITLGGGDYLIVTPASSSHALYYFNDLDDLWDNGWRINGADLESLIKENWDTNKNSMAWQSSYGLDKSIASHKEQIIANMLGASPGSAQIDGGVPYFKGAILMAAGGGAGEDWRDFNYIVPINDAPL